MNVVRSVEARDFDVGHVALWGDDHPTLGDLEVTSLGPGTAIGISAGRTPKPYAHLDANEDAVLAAAGPAGTLLAVADGHRGSDAARAALESVRGRLAILDDQASLPDPEEALRTLLVAARDGVRESLADVASERRQSRTALSVALLSGKELLVAGWGDTQVARVRAGRVRGSRVRLVGGDSAFLEPSSDAPEPVRAGLRDGDVVMACSDGLRDYLPGDWADKAARIVAASADAETATRGLIEAAWAGGAGDHIAVAISQWEA